MSAEKKEYLWIKTRVRSIEVNGFEGLLAPSLYDAMVLI